MLCVAAVEDGQHLLCHGPTCKREHPTLLQDCVANIDDIADIVQDGEIVIAGLLCDLALYGPGFPYVNCYLTVTDRLQYPLFLRDWSFMGLI